MMKKRLFWITVIFCLNVWAMQTAAQYVRKKQQPNFFIPQQEIESRPEKLQMPKTANYQNTEPTTNHIRSEKSRLPAQEAPKQIKKKAPARKVPTVDDDMPEIMENNIDDEPDYQKKYQDYLEDLAEIANEGKVNDTQDVYDDLDLMNSEKMIEVDKNFNKKREKPQAQLDKALNNVLR